MPDERFTTRPATVDDLEAISEIVEAGFESYREFLPAGWQPPPLAREREYIETRLTDPEARVTVALGDADVVGHVGFVPARERRAGDPGPGGPERPLVPGLAHLWQLFVLPEWWGRGAAPLLHELGIEGMRSAGYERGRLFTPAAHARARRFYERRGWSFVDEQHNAELTLDMVEYRLEL